MNAKPYSGKYAGEKGFWSRVDKSGGPDACWPWLGAPNEDGYGTRNYPGSKRRGGAHRIAYIHTFGSIPDGLQLDHLCRNRICVNPKHLEPVTGLINYRRALDAKHGPGGKKVCKNGHEFTAENTRYGKNRRYCKACTTASVARYYQRIKDGLQRVKPTKTKYKKICARGHALRGKNLIWTGHKRKCRECSNEGQRRRKRARLMAQSAKPQGFGHI